MVDLQAIWRRMLESPQAEFLVTPDEVLNYGQLAAQVRSILARFDAHGLLPGDRVLIVTRNEAAAITAFTAALLDGLVPVMLSPETPDARLAGIVQSVAPALLVGDTARALAAGMERVPALAFAPPSVAAPRQRWRSRAVHWSDVLAPGQREPRLPHRLDELAYLLFTSGTTQAPTGVMLTRGNLLANLATLSRLFACTRQTRLFNDMVLAHGDGLVQGPLLALANGGTLIRSGGFNVATMEAWLNRVRLQRATHVVTVPTVWSLIDRYARHHDYFDAPECTHLMSVAARLDGVLWQRVQSRFQRPLYNQYGLTETVASALYAGAQPEMGAFGTIGRPVDCEARVTPLSQVDADTGELQLRGANVFAGYWRDAVRTAEAFTPDGWMRTGDLARQRPDGSYEMCGRLKTVIMSGGFLIRPEEIDEVLAAHPAVAQSVTVGLPDPDFDEIAVTAVVLAEPVQEAALTAHARARLEPLKVPKRILAVPSMARGDAGKPLLGELRALLMARLHSETAACSGHPSGQSFAAVRELAAQVFRVDPASLQPDSSPETVPGWDSFSQVMLVVAAEDRFGVSIPAARVAGIRSLGELQAVLQTHAA